MKKILLITAIVVFGMGTTYAQDDSEVSATSEGKWLIEANTGNAMLGTTGLYFATSDGDTAYNIGFDGGYFVIDDLAIKAGLGYGGFNIDGEGDTSAVSYRLGMKYYVEGSIPVTIDITGASGDEVETLAGENPLWLGLGAGYAWFVSDTVSIEPGLRYNYSLNEDFTDQGIFQVNVGFALYF